MQKNCFNKSFDLLFFCIKFMEVCITIKLHNSLPGFFTDSLGFCGIQENVHKPPEYNDVTYDLLVKGHL